MVIPQPELAAVPRLVEQIEIDDFDFSFLPPADFAFALVADIHSDKRTSSAPLPPEC